MTPNPRRHRHRRRPQRTRRCVLPGEGRAEDGRGGAALVRWWRLRDRVLRPRLPRLDRRVCPLDAQRVHLAGLPARRARARGGSGRPVAALLRRRVPPVRRRRPLGHRTEHRGVLREGCGRTPEVRVRAAEIAGLVTPMIDWTPPGEGLRSLGARPALRLALHALKHRDEALAAGRLCHLGDPAVSSTSRANR